MCTARADRLSEFEIQQRRPQRLAMGIQGQRSGHTATQDAGQHEVQRPELRQLVPANGGACRVQQLGKVGRDALYRQPLGQARVVSRIKGDYRDVRRVALVASTAVGYIAQFRVGTHATSSRCTCKATASLGSNSEATATT